MYQKYQDYGFIVVYVLGEDEKWEGITVEDLQTWVDYFGISHPVLADPHWAETTVYDLDDNDISQTLLAPGAVVTIADEIVTAEQVEAVLPTTYP